jgi:hypothetical protein
VVLRETSRQILSSMTHEFPSDARGSDADSPPRACDDHSVILSLNQLPSSITSMFILKKPLVEPEIDTPGAGLAEIPVASERSTRIPSGTGTPSSLTVGRIVRFESAQLGVWEHSLYPGERIMDFRLRLQKALPGSFRPFLTLRGHTQIAVGDNPCSTRRYDGAGHRVTDCTCTHAAGVRAPAIIVWHGSRRSRCSRHRRP